MKTLIVKYTPNIRSRTKTLLDAFRREIRHLEIELEELDLCSDVPDLISIDALEAYYTRIMYFRSGSSTIPQFQVLSKMDRMTAQFKSADVIVVAFPMYNFSMPATVKAWFDSVMLYGDTFTSKPGGGFIGLMTGKKALTLVAAAGVYRTGNGVSPNFGLTWEHAVSLAKAEFQFMGFSDVRGVLAEGMARDEEVVEYNLKEAIEQIQSITQEWYGAEQFTERSTLREGLKSAT